MRVFVVGAKGLLGSSLCPILQNCGHEVLRQSRTKGVEVNINPADCSALERVLGDICPDVIINLAALTNVDDCEKDPRAAYLANTLIVENLARWVVNENCKTHLIQVSTDQVYDGHGPHHEEDVLLSNYYAFSKYAGELAAIRAGATVLRTNFFGVSRCPGRKTLSDWLVSALRSNTKISIFDDVWFSPLEITSLSKYIEDACRLQISGVFNLGSKNGLTKADFAEKLAEAAGLNITNACRKSVSEVPLKAYRPKDMRMYVQKFEKAFNMELPDFTHEIKKAGKIYTNEV